MFGSGVIYQKNAAIGVGGKLFLSLFGLVFTGAGLLILWLFARDAITGIQTRSWQKTDCAILSSRVAAQGGSEQGGDDFSFEVRYRYTFGGQSFTSTQYERNPPVFEDYGKAARLVEKYPAGANAICYVNPEAPGQAVLVRYNLFFLLVILFPLAFAAFGGFILYSAWSTKSQSQLAAQPISNRAVAGQRPWFSVVFCLVFLLGGSAGLYFVLVRPLFKIQGARAWPPVPCVVISSKVKSDSGGEGTTYRVDIFYSYEFKGRAFKANAYDLVGGSSSGYDDKKDVVDRFPPGTQAICYVNPEDPTEAVLQRGFSPIMWFGLIPLVFVVIGGFGLVFTVRACRQSKSPSLMAIGSGAPVIGAALFTGGAAERVPLQPEIPPWGKFIGMALFCLLWNGIIATPVVGAVRSWRSGHPEWFGIVCAAPFVVVGLILVARVLSSFLALFNPRPRLTITPGAVPLGGKLQVQWKLTGRTSGLQDLSLSLEGWEETSAGSGRSKNTVWSNFAKLEIANVTTSREMQSGEASVTVPAGLVPSFAGANNKIVWAIHVRGRTAWGPDLKGRFPLNVLPAARSSVLSA